MALPPAAAAGVSDERLAVASIALTTALIAMSGSVARAEEPGAIAAPRSGSDSEILGGRGDALRVESVMTRIVSFDQFGYGYQSQAGPTLGKGSERATILEPAIQIVATQGDRLKHVITVPIDVVSAASPDAIDRGPTSADVVSSASRRNIAGTIDWAATYHADASWDVAMDSGLHLEEPFRSWHGGVGATRALAGGDTVVAANFLEVFDWFDRFDIGGHRHGRTDRSSLTGSIGVTQIVTPTTVVAANYGITVQRGELGNTWNSVPLSSGVRGPEVLPDERVRHAWVGRASQFLPWNGALRAYYRLYADDWGLVAHSIEGQLLQRLSPSVYLGALYRFHTQNGVDFFTPRAALDMRFRTADSDLALLDSHAVGGKVVIDIRGAGAVRALHFELEYERYFRNNDLSIDVVTCATGYRF